MTQKKDIKRQKARLEVLKKEAEEEKIRAKADARERVLKEFERGQLGLAGSGGTVGVGAGSEKNTEKGDIGEQCVC